MNDFHNTDLIQWGEQKVGKTDPKSILGEVDYANPPTEFTLRGIRYRYLGVDRIKQGGHCDGQTEFLAVRLNEPNSNSVWVSESFEGEIPFNGFGP